MIGSPVALALVFVLVPTALVLGPRRLRDYAYRELAYRVIADEITKSVTGEGQVADSLLAFVATHEYAPLTIPAIDRTVLNDLVRGIAWCDQQAWALSTLLAKKGIASTLLMLRGYDTDSHHTVASVYVAGQWRIVDPFYKLVFFKPSGKLATFNDLQRPDRRTRLTSPKYAAMDRYDPTFFKQYFKLFEPQYKPIKWAPLTETKDRRRRFVSGIVDFYVRFLGNLFIHRFQDAYLWHPLSHAPDGDLFLRARHYDLFFRRDLALATYKQLLAEHPDDPDVEDALYFMGRVHQDLGQWTTAADTFDALLARFGQNSKWAGMVHYLKGQADEAEHNWQDAINEYRLSATDFQVDSSVRLMTIGE
jgi:hypothetical protein